MKIIFVYTFVAFAVFSLVSAREWRKRKHYKRSDSDDHLRMDVKLEQTKKITQPPLGQPVPPEIITPQSVKDTITNKITPDDAVDDTSNNVLLPQTETDDPTKLIVNSKKNYHKKGKKDKTHKGKINKGNKEKDKKYNGNHEKGKDKRHKKNYYRKQNVPLPLRQNYYDNQVHGEKHNSWPRFLDEISIQNFRRNIDAFASKVNANKAKHVNDEISWNKYANNEVFNVRPKLYPWPLHKVNIKGRNGKIKTVGGRYPSEEVINNNAKNVTQTQKSTQHVIPTERDMYIQSASESKIITNKPNIKVTTLRSIVTNPGGNNRSILDNSLSNRGKENGYNLNSMSANDLLQIILQINREKLNNNNVNELPKVDMKVKNMPQNVIAIQPPIYEQTKENGQQEAIKDSILKLYDEIERYIPIDRSAIQNKEISSVHNHDIVPIVNEHSYFRINDKQINKTQIQTNPRRGQNTYQTTTQRDVQRQINIAANREKVSPYLPHIHFIFDSPNRLLDKNEINDPHHFKISGRRY